MPAIRCQRQRHLGEAVDAGAQGALHGGAEDAALGGGVDLRHRLLGQAQQLAQARQLRLLII